MPRTGNKAANAGNDVPPRSPSKRMPLGDATTLPLTNPPGIRVSKLAEIRPRNRAMGRTRQRSASAVKPSTEQLAALPDQSVPATPASVAPGGANHRSAVPAGKVARVNATYAPTPKAHHDQRVIALKPAQR